MPKSNFVFDLWDNAEKPRGSVHAVQYKHQILGLAFLRYVSDLFDAQAKVINQPILEPTSGYYIDHSEARECATAELAKCKTFYQLGRVI